MAADAHARQAGVEPEGVFGGFCAGGWRPGSVRMRKSRPGRHRAATNRNLFHRQRNLTDYKADSKKNTRLPSSHSHTTQWLCSNIIKQDSLPSCICILYTMHTYTHINDIFICHDFVMPCKHYTSIVILTLCSFYIQVE